ncbi:DUF3048 domain-containing protein [Candidatus Saccharibacteria bacterium]|nr:DUF3048 domain-containing protein [Candidatus Saccharibacteria bacterium]
MKAKKSKNVKLSLEKSQKSTKTPVENSKKKSAKVWTILGILSFLGGIACIVAGFLLPKNTAFNAEFPEVPAKRNNSNIYSNLTGLALGNAEELKAPAYCIQTPNGTDGARPQVGLNQAGVIFEAIAESGITRFAAIYQNPTSAVIGPIRSLRMYYLEWDTPFDCTVVHAGGAPDAIAAVSRGGYKDLTENYSYMYRGSNGNRRWNNLFTTSALLAKMNADRGYGGSDIKGFARMTPEESLKSRVDDLAEEKLNILEPSAGKTSILSGKVLTFGVNFGGLANFNVRYNYNVDKNVYARSYASGVSHDVYVCPEEDLGEKDPEKVCTLEQLSPSVVVVIMVSEKRASDNYHEDIAVIGGGDAYVFQNGTVVRGTWKKGADAEQIAFYDEGGKEIALAPGQTFIEAVPQYGSVDY